ncbi:MAG: hypothetical protein ACM3KF_04300 [Acidobacteriota bacterium]
MSQPVLEPAHNKKPWFMRKAIFAPSIVLVAIGLYLIASGPSSSMAGLVCCVVAAFTLIPPSIAMNRYNARWRWEFSTIDYVIMRPDDITAIATQGTGDPVDMTMVLKNGRKIHAGFPAAWLRNTDQVVVSYETRRTLRGGLEWRNARAGEAPS